MQSCSCRRKNVDVAGKLDEISVPPTGGQVPQPLMPHLLVEDVYKTYEGPSGGVAALRGVSFAMDAGALVALCGPSGCGKSTLLHIVGGMDRATRGRVELTGRPLDQLSPRELACLRRREVGFVFQAFHLLPTLTVAENVALPLSLDGRPARASQARAMQILEEVGLEHCVAKYPAQLSGGEMQRVAVARAVVAQPQLLAADEPTGSLDSENGQRVLQLLCDLNRRRGLTILLATHSQEAARCAQRTIHMRDGQIERIEQHVDVSTSV
jgi:putative ABC transport system ATP-binding protein